MNLRPEPTMQLPQANQNPTPNPSQGQSSADDHNASETPRALKDKVIEATKSVYDPEIPVNIYELGLIYEVHVSEETGHVHIVMTLTTPNCPEAQSLPQMVQSAIEAIDEVEEASVQITWEPMWDKDMMSDEAKFTLGLI